jgi:DNA-binding response OmpR family regulator
VDDDPILLMGTAAILTQAGYDCHCARDPGVARMAVRTLPIDLILCDVYLAGESGLELCRELRQEPGLEDVPVMFMSSAQLPDIVRKSHDAGGAYFLKKPFEPRVLIELVGKALWMPHLVHAQLNRLREKHAPIVAASIPAPAIAPSVPVLPEKPIGNKGVHGVPAPLGMPGLGAATRATTVE